jgi:hypothetical protein
LVLFSSIKYQHESYAEIMDEELEVKEAEFEKKVRDSHPFLPIATSGLTRHVYWLNCQ